jgi:deazaflavin-dependent oxidoreductase (nitroreductase family)
MGEILSLGTRIMNPLVIFLYRLTGGRVAGHFGKAPIMLLTTTGIRTGKQRTNPVLYVLDGDNLVTVASAGGADKNPGWFKNLMHDPEAVVQVRREKIRVRADKASTEERRRLWPLLTRAYPTYDDYVRRTNREIPVVVLRPAQRLNQ